MELIIIYMDIIKILGGDRMPCIEPIFCTYFKSVENFRYDCETYEECVAFCVRTGSFSYRIDNEKEKNLSEGEVVICPPYHRFSRKIVVPAEICMIKFYMRDRLSILGKKIKISNPLRFHDDLCGLESCLYCHTLPEEPLFAHYCMDILYLAIGSMQSSSELSAIKEHIERNYDKDISIRELAKQAGYTVPHLISKFRLYYGVTPKAYVLQIRLLKAKELLLTTDKLSREIADELGFSDELYFIRFFKKRVGMTPKQFRRCKL